MLPEVYTVLDGSLTFDVLVLTGKARWTSVSRWPDAMAAQNEARKLVATKKHLGVKVSQETFDHAENRFMEKTLFKHLKNDNDRMAPAVETASEFSDVATDELDEFYDLDDFSDYDDERDWVAPVFGIFTALAIIVGLGVFFIDEKIDIGKSSKSEYFVYALPAAIATMSNGDKPISVRVDLQLELDGARDAEAVELALAQIMDSVVQKLQNTQADHLQESEKIQLLRAELKQRIQDAMGETNLNGVLFNNIQVF